MTYSPELDGAMGGLSTVVPVDTTAGGQVLIAAATSSNRRYVILTNRDEANPIYYNFGIGVTAASTGNASLKAGESIKLNVRNTIYAISTGGVANVEVTTVEDP